MKNFFGKIKDWFIKHKPSKRRLIQLYAALLHNANLKGFVTGNIYQGASKQFCLPGFNCYSCPGAVGACPLGSLQNALAASKTTVPAYIFGIIILFGLTLGRTICGFLCPVGLTEELLYKIKTPKVQKSKFTYVLSYLKYVILAVFVVAIPLMYSGVIPVPAFCKYICPVGTAEGAGGLLSNPNNDDLFTLLGGLFTWKFILLVLFIVGSIFFFRFFCRFFCPLGAIYGFFCKLAMLGVKIDKDKCTDCGLCISACKMDVRKVGDHECIHCGECMSACTTKAIVWKGSEMFLKGSDCNTPAPVGKPLSQFLKAVEQPQESVETTQTQAVAEETQTQERAEIAVAQESEHIPTVGERVKKRNKVLEIVAWSLAGVVLVSSLVYYNFIHKDAEVGEGYEVGCIAPDFTVDIYGSDESFTLSENTGKLTVVNFWATWCTPCVAELPYFEEFYSQYGDQINLVAIHGTAVTEDVSAFISEKFNGYQITFAQDAVQAETEMNVYNTYGGVNSWPTTVIIDEEGVILYNSAKSFHSAQDLIDLIVPMLGE